MCTLCLDLKAQDWASVYYFRIWKLKTLGVYTIFGLKNPKAREVIIVHACTMIKVHARTMIIVLACTMIIVNKNA